MSASDEVRIAAGHLRRAAQIKRDEVSRLSGSLRDVKEAERRTAMTVRLALAQAEKTRNQETGQSSTMTAEISRLQDDLGNKQGDLERQVNDIDQQKRSAGDQASQLDREAAGLESLAGRV